MWPWFIRFSPTSFLCKHFKATVIMSINTTLTPTAKENDKSCKVSTLGYFKKLKHLELDDFKDAIKVCKRKSSIFQIVFPWGEKRGGSKIGGMWLPWFVSQSSVIKWMCQQPLKVGKKGMFNRIFRQISHLPALPFPPPSGLSEVHSTNKQLMKILQKVQHSWYGKIRTLLLL